MVHPGSQVGHLEIMTRPILLEEANALVKTADELIIPSAVSNEATNFHAPVVDREQKCNILLAIPVSRI